MSMFFDNVAAMMRHYFYGLAVIVVSLLVSGDIAAADGGCSLPERSLLGDMVTNDLEATIAIRDSKTLCVSELLESSAVLVLYQCTGSTSCGGDGLQSVLLDLVCVDGAWQLAASERMDSDSYNGTSSDQDDRCSHCLNMTTYQNLHIYPVDSADHSAERHCLGKRVCLAYSSGPTTILKVVYPDSFCHSMNL